MHENISDSEDYVAVTDLSTPKNATDITYQRVIDLSDTQKKLKANSRNNKLQCLNEKIDDNEKNVSAVDKVKAFNLVTKENIETGKINTSAWCNLKWNSSLFTNRHAHIKHKLPLMPPPERGRNKTTHLITRNDCNEQKKKVSNADVQTDTVYIVSEEDYDLIQFMKCNGITKEALTISLEYYDDDINNNIENQPELEQVSIPLPEEERTTEDKSSGEEKEVNNLIDKYSEENKAKLSNFFGCLNNKVADLSTDPIINKSKDKNFFEYIHNSLWQIVICMSNYKESAERDEKVRAFADKSTQTEIVKNASNKNENNFSPTAALKEVRLPKQNITSNKAEYNMIGQKPQVIQRVYQTPQARPAPAPTPRPPQPRAPRQPHQPAQHIFQEPLIKRPRPNPPDTSQESVNRLNGQLQSTNFSAPRWQIGPPKNFGGEWRLRYSSNMARPQWYNQMSPLPPPPPQYNQEHMYASQNTFVGQFPGSLQQHEIAEYQRYQQMEMQKKAWESQLKNYPNCAWSQPEN